MKKLVKITAVIIVIGIVGGYIYWQFNKNKIIKNTITKAISKKTDSLYYLHYDSSRIDEINGNATFYNVSLQSDSTQKAILKSSDSLPNALYNIRISEVAVTGVDIAGLLEKQNVAAKKIVLLRPVIQIINTGAGNPKPFTMNDTLELYRKMLGKFESIKADSIRITDGTLLITNKEGKVQTALEKINVTLAKFLVDSTKDYKSIISYFIKDVRVTIENVQLPETKGGTRINFENVDYNAGKRYLYIAGIKQYKVNNVNPVTDLKNVQVSDLNTDAFILQQQLKAGLVSCQGGVVTIYIKKNPGKSKKGGRSLELSTDIIDQAQIAGISLGSTKVIIADKDKPETAPFVLNNTHFKVTKMLRINEGNTVSNIINSAEWELSADGFSFLTKTKMYKISVGNFVINNAASLVQVKNLSLAPVLSEQEFVQKSTYQQDQYNLALSNIILSGINIKKFIDNNEIEVESASFRPIIKIFNDRTLPPLAISKIGNYPHQQVLNLPFPVYVRTIKIDNALVSYRERAAKSKLIGDVSFSNINATLTNLTNIPARIKSNNLFKMNATAKFLGTGTLSSEWRFPLDAGNGAFSIKGRLGSMSALTLNSIIEPLAMASVKEGQIDNIEFSVNGNDTKSTGDVLFLYHDLKLDILKVDDDKEFKKKGLVSLFANMLIKNENTSNVNRKAVKYDRDLTRSFFNLVWKTIFTGAKKTVIGRKTKEIDQVPDE